MDFLSIFLKYLLKHAYTSIILLLIGFIYIFSKLSLLVNRKVSKYFQNRFLQEGKDKYIKYLSILKISWDYLLIVYCILVVGYLGVIFFLITWDKTMIGDFTRALISVTLMVCEAALGFLFALTIKGKFSDKYVYQLKQELKSLSESDYISQRVAKDVQINLGNYIAKYSDTLRDKEEYKKKFRELSQKVYSAYIDQTIEKPYLRGAYLKHENKVHLIWEYIGPNIIYKINRKDISSNSIKTNNIGHKDNYIDDSVEETKTYEYWLTINVAGTDIDLSNEKVIISCKK